MASARESTGHGVSLPDNHSGDAIPATHRHAIRAILEYVDERVTGGYSRSRTYRPSESYRTDLFLYDPNCVSTWMIDNALQGFQVDYKLSAHGDYVIVKLLD